MVCRRLVCPACIVVRITDDLVHCRDHPPEPEPEPPDRAAMAEHAPVPQAATPTPAQVAPAKLAEEPLDAVLQSVTRPEAVTETLIFVVPRENLTVTFNENRPDVDGVISSYAAVDFGNEWHASLGTSGFLWQHRYIVCHALTTLIRDREEQEFRFLLGKEQAAGWGFYRNILDHRDFNGCQLIFLMKNVFEALVVGFERRGLILNVGNPVRLHVATRFLSTADSTVSPARSFTSADLDDAQIPLNSGGKAQPGMASHSGGPAWARQPNPSTRGPPGSRSVGCPDCVGEGFPDGKECSRCSGVGLIARASKKDDAVRRPHVGGVGRL